MSYCIAIDGPAGAGKSTIARLIAKKKGMIYVDTGSMYRAMAFYFLRKGIRPEDMERISQECENADITIRYENQEQIIYLNGENVNAYLRTEEVGNMTSKISVNPKIREKMVKLQRKLAAEESVVMDGRDIGTCVLPNADVKIYLTASSRVRAGRRFEELAAKGETPDFDSIEADIKERDNRDMHRKISPLCQAEDAVLVDSSEMTIEEVVERILAIAEEKR